MTVERLAPGDLAQYLGGCPAEWCDLLLEVRRQVLGWAPQASEAIRFGALCYFRAGAPYGVIGGNVCMITARDHGVYLQFIHGAMLPDPGHLLQGRAKAKRYVVIRTSTDLTDPDLAQLVRAAARYTPAK